jgi:imipenem/basic amino acid-specific outer membrane pore
MKFVKKQGEYMKFTKLSLAAALLAGSAAFAIDNIKISGDANVYYSTTDALQGYDAVLVGAGLSNQTSGDLFSKDSSAADASINLNVTADLLKNDLVTVSAGAGYTVIATLGLENNFVSNVWGTSHTATFGGGQNYANALTGAKVENANWMNEAWVAATVGKTTAKLGRMELDTPIAFTEKWSIEKNTFEAAVLINQDIPDTTVVAAYVGNSNGVNNNGLMGNDGNSHAVLAMGGVVASDGKFTTLGQSGAYALGVINNSWKPLTVQGWYYDLPNYAKAYWLEADLNIKGMMFGAQYMSGKVNADDLGVATTSDLAKSSGTYAVMAGYEMKDVFTAKVSYSDTSKKGAIHGGNIVGSGQSKLYTEAWWNYGKITQADTQSYNVTIESPVNGLFDLGVYYTDADQKAAAGDNDLTELTVTVGKSFGPADLTLAYINADIKTPTTYGDDETSNTVQAYITVNF